MGANGITIQHMGAAAAVPLQPHAHAKYSTETCEVAFSAGCAARSGFMVVLKVPCMRFKVIHCEKISITYIAMFILVSNHLHIVIVVVLFT